MSPLIRDEVRIVYLLFLYLRAKFTFLSTREIPCLRSLRQVKMPFEIRHFVETIFYLEKVGVRIPSLLFL